MSRDPVEPDTRVGDQRIVDTCPYCGRPFTAERALALHLGEVHEEALTEEQRTRYERAYDEEDDELFMFHVKTVVLLGLLYLAIVLVYLVVLS